MQKNLIELTYHSDRHELIKRLITEKIPFTGLSLEKLKEILNNNIFYTRNIDYAGFNKAYSFILLLDDKYSLVTIKFAKSYFPPKDDFIPNGCFGYSYIITDVNLNIDLKNKLNDKLVQIIANINSPLRNCSAILIDDLNICYGVHIAYNDDGNSKTSVNIYSYIFQPEYIENYKLDYVSTFSKPIKPVERTFQISYTIPKIEYDMMQEWVKLGYNDNVQKFAE